MMAGLGIEVEGFEELKKKIVLLGSDKDKKREMLLILRQIAKPTLAAAKLIVPVGTRNHRERGMFAGPGTLKKSLGNITGKGKNPTVYVGARVKGSNRGWYAHFVHDGVNYYKKGFKRKHIRGANNHAAIGSDSGFPFLTKAYEQTKGVVTADAEKKMAKFIQRRINKLSK